VQIDQHITNVANNLPYAHSYVGSDVLFINPPGLYNSSWQGLLFNFSIALAKDAHAGSVCNVYKQLIASIRARPPPLRVGDGALTMATDQPDVCPPDRPKCGAGAQVCRDELHEVCIHDVCTCPAGAKRANVDAPCTVVEGFPLALWVLRHGQDPLTYNSTIGNPQQSLFKLYADLFAGGVLNAYKVPTGATPIGAGFVTDEVNYIVDPKTVNGTWDTGIFVNFTVYFVPGTLQRRADAWTELLRLINANNLEIGNSSLFISATQQNPFGACFHNDCDKDGAVCAELSDTDYTCVCRANYIDLAPVPRPGRQCRSQIGYNECLRPTDNNCTIHTRCIDLPFLFKCECITGFKV
jgi:hypothetical protein